MSASDLDPRQRGALRDAMVLGFCLGAMSSVDVHTNPADYPRDSEVVERVLSAADRHSDLYPALSEIAAQPQAEEASDGE